MHEFYKKAMRLRIKWCSSQKQDVVGKVQFAGTMDQARTDGSMQAHA